MAGSGEIAAVGQTTTIEIKIDNLNASLWYYNISVALGDPDIGEIVNLHFPSWIQLGTNSTYPADSVIIKGGALSNQPQAGAINTSLGSVEIRGDRAGETGILLTVNSMQTQYGEEIVPPAVIMNGRIKVASSNGSIDVRSIPDGAMISLDGASTGLVTNTTIGDVLPGLRTVRVTKDGYKPAETTVSVVAGETANADFVLEQLTGSIKVTSVPPDAEIFIDNVDTHQQTNATINGVLPGTRTVKVTRDDYKPVELPVTVVADQTVNADFVLEQLSGSIHVTSVPPDAEIFIDDVDTGKQTNTTIDNVIPGTRTVKVTKNGFKPAELPVSVVADQTVDADFILEQLTGSIHVTSVPPDAEIFIDDADTGKQTNTTIAGVLPGLHTVKVTKDDYKPAELPVTVVADQTVNANFVLEQLTGSVHVTSVPPDAEIFIDNADTGKQTNTTVSGITPGLHTVKVTKDDYKPAELPVTVVADQTVNADFVLEQLTGSVHVTSVPPDAEIFIDNVDTGKKTNDTVSGILPGLRTVKVTKDDYKPAELPVTVVADQTVDADFILEQLTGSIHVTSVPPDAEIFIDNADTGKQTNSTVSGITPGLHTVKVTKDDYKPAELPVTVITEQTVNADFILEQITGSIHVTSVPPGAKIFIDNADTGKQTNSTVSGITPGLHTVKVTKDDYKPAELPVTVVADQTVNADFVLEELTGSIHVTSVPDGAKISLDGASTGLVTNTTIDNVLPGLHTVKVMKDWYKPAEMQITVVADDTVNADFVLEQITGSIHVTSVPPGAKIFIDNVDTRQQTNTTIDSVIPGLRTVKVTKTGYKPAEMPVTVEADKTVDADFTLEQLTGSIHVTSVPDGAKIYLDNVDSGSQTNTTIDNVLPGLHTVKVMKDWYKPAEMQITVVAEQTVDADFTLEQLTGSIHVTSVPSDAEIFIDNVDTHQQTNTTIAGVTPGLHTVKVAKDWYKPAEQTVTVVAEQTVDADFILEQLLATGSIRVTSVPSGAEIFVDNVDTGKQTNSTIGGIIPGDHKVKVSLARYREAEKTVTVATGATAPADFILERLPGLPRAQFLAFPRQGTAPLTVLFVDLSQGSPASRVWDFGDGSTSTERFPLHTYKSAGRYTVKLTVSNSAGSDTLTRENYITVNPENPPKAQFVAYPRQGREPLTVLFLDLSRGNPSSRVWDFGDGSTSTDRFPVHTYENSGKYTVRLTVSNSGGSDTLTRESYITVMAARPPNAQFTASPHEGTAPLTVTFRDVSRGSPTSRLWDFGDGFTSTEPAPVHTYTAAGKYTVTLTVANDAGSDTAVMKDFISVTAKKQGTPGPGDSGGKRGGEGEKPDSSGSKEKPKIKLS